MSRSCFFLMISVVMVAGCGTSASSHDVLDGEDVVDVASGPEFFTIMTFNTGTTENMDHTYDEDGYDNVLAGLNSEYFGNNLAWLTARAALRELIDTNRPDVIAFQELFYDPECDEICQELDQTDEWAVVCNPETGVFVCADWVDADTTELTVREAVGPDYEVVCAPNHNDNCIAVRKDFGSIAVAETAVETAGAWINGLDGMPPPNGCTNGARVATGVVSIKNGPDVAVVDVHTVAGNNSECRKSQFQQVFEDRGDGKPATFGEHNIVLGDMNMDPFTFRDVSVDYWNERVGEGKPFHYISASDETGPMTHPVSFSRLDHVISDSLDGSCVVLGVTDGTQAPISDSSTYFDHRPVLCTVDLP